MGIDQILNIATLLGMGWSVLVYLPKTVIAVYKSIDDQKDSINLTILGFEKRLESLDAKFYAREQEINHRLDLHIQQTLMTLDRINDSILTVSNSLAALHKRLDNYGKDNQ